MHSSSAWLIAREEIKSSNNRGHSVHTRKGSLSIFPGGGQNVTDHKAEKQYDSSI